LIWFALPIGETLIQYRRWANVLILTFGLESVDDNSWENNNNNNARELLLLLLLLFNIFNIFDRF
jgi:hypothetical protein